MLLEKGRPAWLAGLWNGIGGHVERGEYPFDAMVREAAEEAALPPLPWAHPGVINTTQDESDPLGTAQLVVFAARGNVDAARALTDEPVRAFTWDEVEGLPLANTTRAVLEHVRAFAAQSPAADFYAPPASNTHDSDRLYAARLSSSVWGVRQNHEILDTLMLPAPEVLALTLPRSISVPPQGFRRTPK